ncbi:uncharacterized protein LOC142170259 [Nicotiana tabacum]|uniref:Uncharacterized protein LOC142170259 n=1 Tax=Nicotiana tabacum TaxID=4097 RepID=A0AC58STB9_TOBAC
MSPTSQDSLTTVPDSPSEEGNTTRVHDPGEKFSDASNKGKEHLSSEDEDDDDEYESIEGDASSDDQGKETTNKLVEPFSSQQSQEELYDVNVDQEFGDITEQHHLSPRGVTNVRGIAGGRQRECEVVDEDEQVITCELGTPEGIQCLVSIVYAKCQHQLRLPLWDTLRGIAAFYNLPWVVIGDFNCITDAVEKKGGLPHKAYKSIPFQNCMVDCCLTDAGYNGSTYTWCNGRSPKYRIWKRLDRALLNHEWLDIFPKTQVSHLSRVGFDHAPLLVTIEKQHGRKRKLLLNIVQKGDGSWAIGEEEIPTQATEFYQNLFKKADQNINQALFNTIPKLIEESDNKTLITLPTEEEIKEVVFSMYADSSPGPDGFSTKFYQTCWGIIKGDLIRMIKTFFSGDSIPKSITHTCLVLLPKIDNPKTMSDLRPISLGNVSCKIISKLLNSRLSPLLPKLISSNQFGFIKELLSRLMNKLPENANFSSYTVDKHSPLIMHLSYVDDTILFTSGDLESIRLMMLNLKIYEEISGQLRNKEKSSFLVAPKATQNFIEEIKMMTSFQYKYFPVTYLGAPIYVERKKVCYFNDMITKVTNRVQVWNNKLIFAGGRAILVKSVLYSLSMHIMAAIDPPKTTLNHIEKVISNFFWGEFEGRPKHHWFSWKSLCYSQEEGSAGFRSTHDICLTFAAKNWWRLRSQQSLWRECIEAKYCKRIHPVAKKWRHGQSHIWRRLMEIKHMGEPLILWNPNAAECSFWWDDWPGLGPLAKFVAQGPKPGKMQLKHVYDGETWNF